MIHVQEKSLNHGESIFLFHRVRSLDFESKYAGVCFHGMIFLEAYLLLALLDV